MKLLTKYSRINIIATSLIFLAASTGFYFALNFVLIHQVDDDLKIEQDEITAYAGKYQHLPEDMKVKDQVLSYTPTVAPGIKNNFSTIIVKEGNEEHEKYRQLQFSIKAGEQWYTIAVSKSLEETNEIIDSVLLICLGTILLMLAVSFVINRLLLKRIWNPFYQSLEGVKSFRINKETNLLLPTTEIDEFRFMNTTLEALTRQAKGDYLALKTFSENASHEIQTPIAIVRSKLDLLIQDEGLTQKQSERLESAYNAVQRLTTLNQHLLLLAKIENRQFAAMQPIELEKQTEKKMADFSELWEIEGLQIHFSLQPVTVQMNADLANILLNNLYSNATKHNYRGGQLFIETDAEKLVIKNTSKVGPLDQEKLFMRFFKPTQNGDSNGLGLSIIKQICNASGFTITYEYHENLHVFAIKL